MSPARLLPLGVLLAASSLSAQQVTISGAGGVANETYSQAHDTSAEGFIELRLGFLFDYLVVGGGGAGGTAGGSGGENTWGAGGGGAGGVVSGQVELYTWAVGADEGKVSVTVGAGGAAASYSAGSTANGDSGAFSSLATPFETFTALGGGGGAGSNNSSTGGVGLNGASGGGGGGDGLRAGGSGTAGQGFGGGTSRTSAGNRSAGGGGGGAGGVGQIGGPPLGHSSGVGGNGGVGVANTITGASVTYGGGGGGGGRDTNSGATSAGGSGGSGGGGAGSGQGAATSGTDGLGGGGGGSGADGKGGDGGDGIVVVRYKGAAAGTGGTITSGTGTAAGYTLHTFASVGSTTLDLSGTDVSSRLGSVVSSTITGSGSLSIFTRGTIAYIGSATHTGGTDVQVGTFQLGNGGANGSIADSAVTIGSGATFAIKRSDAILTLYNNFSGAGTFAKKGVNQVSLQGDFSGLSGAIEIENGVLNLSNGYGTSYAVSAGTSGAGALTKSSDGTVILSGNLAHTGGTTVSRGKLVINGTHDGAVTVLMGAGAGVLGGSGTITGDATIYGIHAPGNSPGIQTFAGNLTYESGSFLQWELGAQATTNSPLVFDQIVVGGNLTFAGPTNLTLNFSTWVGSTVDWSDAFWNSNRSWLLIDVAGTTTGFENLSLYSAALSGNWTDSNGVTFATGLDGAGWSLSLVDNDVYINYTAAVPEPSTYGLILGGLALAGAAIRRRRTAKNSK